MEGENEGKGGYDSDGEEEEDILCGFNGDEEGIYGHDGGDEKER